MARGHLINVWVGTKPEGCGSKDELKKPGLHSVFVLTILEVFFFFFFVQCLKFPRCVVWCNMLNSSSVYYTVSPSH